jgi:hypothetical protein
MLFAISLSTCNRVGKRTSWILIRLRGCAGWSGSMLVANALCWFCHDAAHIVSRRTDKTYSSIHICRNILDDFKNYNQIWYKLTILNPYFIIYTNQLFEFVFNFIRHPTITKTLPVKKYTLYLSSQTFCYINVRV